MFVSFAQPLPSFHDDIFRPQSYADHHPDQIAAHTGKTVIRYETGYSSGPRSQRQSDIRLAGISLGNAHKEALDDNEQTTEKKNAPKIPKVRKMAI